MNRIVSKGTVGFVALLMVTLTVAQPASPLRAAGSATILARTVMADSGAPAIGVQIYVATSVGVAQYRNTAWGGVSVINLLDDVTDAYVFGIAPNYGPTCWGYAYAPIAAGERISVTIPIVCYPIG